MRHTLLGDLALLALLLTPVSAQPEAAEGRWITPVEGSKSFFDVDFPGGTLEEFVEGIRGAADDRRVLTSPEAARVVLPPITLTRVSLWSALHAPSYLVPGVSVSNFSGGSAEPGPDGLIRETSHFAVRIEPEALVTRSAPPLRFDLDFPGGKVADYVKAVRAAHPEANVLVTPEAALFEMAPVRLHDVTTEAALHLISRTFGNPRYGVSVIGVRAIEITGSTEPVFRIDADSSAGIANQSVVISLAPLLDAAGAAGLTIDDILSAVEAATNMTTPPPTIRYHEPTSLLLFYGTVEQAETLQRTIDALGRTAGATRE